MSAVFSTRLLIAGCVLAMGSFAQAATADNASLTSTAPRAPVMERNVLTAQAVQVSADAEQLVTLTTAAEHFSALYLPANQAVAQGVVILLPGVGETFDWPLVTGPLRRNLPNAGWHTLSLNLPEPPPEQLIAEQFIADPVPEQIVLEPPLPVAIEPESIEPAEEADAAEDLEEIAEIEEPEESLAELEDFAQERADDTATDEDSAALAPVAVEPIPIPAYPQRINDFIQAAIGYAETLNAKEIILLGHHERAHWVLNYPAAQTSLTPIRLVLIAPRNSRFVATPYQELIRISSLPIADFYYKGVFTEQQAAQQRLNASRRAALRDYHQVALSANSGSRSVAQEQLFRRVKGWLNKALNAQYTLCNTCY